MSNRYEHLSTHPLPGGVRLEGRVTIPEAVTVTALPSKDGSGVRLEGGYVTLPLDAARLLLAALADAIRVVEAGSSKPAEGGR